MLLPRILAVLTTALCTLAAADIIIGEETCLTRFSARSVRHVPTHTTSQTIQVILVTTKTKHPRTTVTPTSTITAGSIEIDTTTLGQVTDTVTSTAIITTTSTLVVDISQITTEEVTTTIAEAPTVTISTSAGFTPFASEPAVIAAGGGSTSPPSKKKRREAPQDKGTKKRNNNKEMKVSGSRFPKAVNCVVFFEDIVTQTTTLTALNTQTHLAPAVIATTTSVATITSTVVLGVASTTMVTTSVATSLTVLVNVEMTTVTSVTTSTSFIGDAFTYYPQCQNDNLIEYVGGMQLYPLLAGPGGNSVAETPDAVTCCQMCAIMAGCAGFSGPTPGFTDCYLFQDNGTCDASMGDWAVYLANTQTSDFDVVGNGNCGQGIYGGNYP